MMRPLNSSTEMQTPARAHGTGGAIVPPFDDEFSFADQDVVIPMPSSSGGAAPAIAPAMAPAVVAPMAAARPPRRPAPASLWGVTGTCVVFGAVTGVSWYLSAKAWDKIDADWTRYLNNFCTQNPFVYVGSEPDCVNYWNQQGQAYYARPQQVCDHLDPSRCATFNPNGGGGPVGEAVAGMIVGMLFGLGTLATAIWSLTLSIKWAQRR